MKRWKLIWHFQIKIIINILPTSSVIFCCAWEETRAGSVHWTYQSGSSRARVHLSQMLICSAQLWGQKCSTCIWCKITWAGMPSPSSLGFCLRPRERCDTLGRAKCPFVPPPRSGGSHSCGEQMLWGYSHRPSGTSPLCPPGAAYITHSPKKTYPRLKASKVFCRQSWKFSEIRRHYSCFIYS